MRSCLLAHGENRSSQRKDLCHSVVLDGVRQAKLPHIDVKNHEGDLHLEARGKNILSSSHASEFSRACQRRFRIQRQGHPGRASCRKRSTHQTSMIETMTGLPQWRWTRFVVPRPSMGEPDSATRSLASAHCCGVTVTGLHAHDILLCESEAIIHETTVTTGIDPRAAARSKATNYPDDEPGSFEEQPWSKTPNTYQNAPGSSLMLQPRCHNSFVVHHS